MAKFVKDSLWSGLRTAIASILGMLGQGIINHCLGPSGRGTMSLIQTVSGTTYNVSFLGTTYASSYLIARGDEFCEVATADQIISLCASFVSCSALMVLAYIRPESNGVAITWALVVAAMPTALFRGLNSISGPLTGKQCFYQLSIFGIGGACAFFLARLLLVPTLNIKGALLAEAAFIAVPAILGLRFAFTNFGRPRWPQRQTYFHILRYGVATAPALISQIVIQSAIVFILYAQVGAKASGLYSAIYAFMMPFKNFSTIVGNILRPRSAKMDNSDAVTKIGISLRISLYILIVAMFALIVFADVILWLFGGMDFVVATNEFRLYSITILCANITLIVFGHLDGSGHPEYSSISGIITAIIIIGLALYLTPSLGLMGGIIADIAGLAAQMAMALFFFCRYRRISIVKLLAPRFSDIVSFCQLLQNR